MTARVRYLHRDLAARKRRKVRTGAPATVTALPAKPALENANTKAQTELGWGARILLAICGRGPKR